MDLDVDYLGKLARIHLTAGEKEKFSKELKKVLDHFEELKSVNTDSVEPMTGGTSLESVVRPDEELPSHVSLGGKARFPEEKDGYLKVPKMFE